MRKLIFIIAFLITSFAFAQGGPKVDVVKFRGEVTETVRNTFDVPVGEYWMIYNTTTDRLEMSDSSDTWIATIKEGQNTVADGIYLTESVTNSISIIPASAGYLGGVPAIRIIGGAQGSETYYVIANDRVSWSFGSSLEEYEINPLGETDPNDLVRKSYADALAAGGINLGNSDIGIQPDVIRSITVSDDIGLGNSALHLRNSAGIQMRLQDTGISFTNPPISSTLPTATSHLTNKSYVDGLNHTDNQTFDVAQISGDVLELSLDNVAALTSIDISSVDNQTLSTNPATDASIEISGGNILALDESIQDVVGNMVTTNTEAGIDVTYDDTTGKLNFNVTSTASTITYDNTISGLTATNVKTAIDEVNTGVEDNVNTIGNNASEISAASTRIDSVVTVLGTANTSSFTFDTKTTPATAVLADAQDSKIIFLDYADETYTIPSGVFDSGQSIRIQSTGNGIAEILPATGVSFAPFDGFQLDSITKAITIVRVNTDTAPEVWFPLDGYIKNFVGAYSPNNLYVETSAVNADNYSAVRGSWNRQNNVNDGTTATLITANVDSPTVTGGSAGSLRFFDNTPSTYERMQLNVSGLTISNSYKVRFWLKAVTTGMDTRVRIASGGNTDLDLTIATFGDWYQYELDFTPLDTTADIWIVPNWNSTAVTEDMYMTNFELIQN